MQTKIQIPVKCLLLLITIIGSALCATATPKASETEANHAQHHNLKNGLAIKGYDPVSYFSGKPTKGSKHLSHKLEGATYRFSSAENLKKFQANPSKYEPQHGGWCSYAFAYDARKVKINPKRYKIVDGKLYLFYDTVFGPNTLKLWNEKGDAPQIQKADANWEKTQLKK